MKQIIPAILSTTLQDYQTKVRAVENLVKYVHIDIMDGLFVSHKTLTLTDIKNTPTKTSREAHFMVEKPWNHVAHAARAGINTFIFHIEACPTPFFVTKTLDLITKHNLAAAIAVSPETPITSVFPFVPRLAHVLIMTVHPGKGGQEIIPATLKKISTLKKHFPTLTIEADGGINATTIHKVLRAGASLIVMGSAIYGQKNIRTKLLQFARFARSQKKFLH